MPRPTIITYELVAKTADTLALEGQRVTVDRVREAIGFGSNTTITPLLAIWRDRRAQQASPEIKTELPADLANAISTFISIQVDAAKAAADRRIAEERTEVDELVGKTDALREELASALMRVEGLENELLENVGRLKQREDDMEGLRRRIRELDASIGLIEKNAAASVALAEMNAARAIAEAEKAATKSIAEAEKAAAVAIAKLDRSTR